MNNQLFKEESGVKNSGYYYATIITRQEGSPYLLIEEWQESAEDGISRYGAREITEKQAQRFFNR